MLIYKQEMEDEAKRLKSSKTMRKKKKQKVTKIGSEMNVELVVSDSSGDKVVQNEQDKANEQFSPGIDLHPMCGFEWL